MIAAGYLVDVRGIRVGLEAIDLEAVAQKGGDFDADQLGDALEQASAPAHVLAAYLEHASDRKTVVFVPTVALAHRMAETFRQAGVAAEALDGSTDAQLRLGIPRTAAGRGDQSRPRMSACWSRGGTSRLSSASWSRRQPGHRSNTPR